MPGTGSFVNHMCRSLLLMPYCLLFSLQYSYAQQPGDNFKLSGKIEGVDNKMIYLSYYDEHIKAGKLDSAFIRNGLFTFYGKLKQPTVAFIKLNKREAIGLSATDIFIEPANMSIELTLNEFANAHMTGSATQNDYQTLRAKRNQIVKNHPRLFDGNGYLHKDLDTALAEMLKIVFDSLNKVDYAYFDQHPKSYLTAYLLQYHVRNLSPDSTAMFYNRLGENLKRHPVTQTIRSRLKNMEAGSVGTIAPHFFAKDTSGNEFYSGFVKGKYVLLDFWASWCLPCRENSPHLINLFKKYKDNGLRIVGIADDRDLDKWKLAITADKTNIWTHIRREPNPDLKKKGLNDVNDINEKYGIATLPTYILIDGYGVIIGRFEKNSGSINELVQRLEALFSEISPKQNSD